MPEIEVGTVSTFFSRPVVAGIKLSSGLKVGEQLRIRGHTTDLTFVLDSMQINNVNVAEAKVGDEIGIKVPDRVRPGDRVYRVTT